MAAKSADSARSAAARSQAVAKSKKADMTTRASMPKLTKMTVSQSTIDKIKSDGMTSALAKVGAGKASSTYVEGVKRMYGVARINAAKNKGANAAKSGRTNSPYGFGGVGAPKKRATGGGKGMASK